MLFKTNGLPVKSSIDVVALIHKTCRINGVTFFHAVIDFRWLFKSLSFLSFSGVGADHSTNEKQYGKNECFHGPCIQTAAEKVMRASPSLQFIPSDPA